MPISIDGTAVSDVTIDGDAVTEITVDGDVVWTATSYPIIIDSFEDQDIAEYTGETGPVSVSSTVAYDGSYALGHTYSGSSLIRSTSGLNAYPSQGDTIRWNGYFDGTADGYVGLNVATGNNKGTYQCRMNASKSQYNFQLIKWSSGGAVLNDWTTTVTYSPDTWYEAELDWHANGFDVRLFEPDGTQKGSTLDVNDTEWTSGGIGWNLDGTYCVADYARIVS